jgi:hypothetical protein
VPWTILPNDYEDFCFSYLIEGIEKYDFLSAERDWFSAYFETGYPNEISYGMSTEADLPTGYGRILTPRKEKYTYFRYDSSTQRIFTLFRGVKIELSSTSLTDPIVSLYDGYKFSVILVPEEEDNFSYEDRVRCEVITNEKFKFILVKFICKIASYRSLFSNLSYLGIYTTADKRDYAKYAIDNAHVTSNDENLGYEFLKTLAADYPLSSPIDFSQFSPDYVITPGIFNPFDAGIDTTRTDYTKEINPLRKSGEFSSIASVFLSSPSYTFTAISPRVKNAFDKETLEFSDTVGYFYNPSMGISVQINFPDPSKSWEEYFMFYVSGGDGALEETRKLLSFSELSKALDNTSEKISTVYSRVDAQGATYSYAQYSFSFFSPERLARVQELVPINDENFPSELYAFPVIGSNLVLENSPANIYRYPGEYVPKYRDILEFSTREETSMAIEFGVDFRGKNTYFLPTENNGIIPNCYLMKVSEKEILRIPGGGAFQSIYPYVDETGIDTKDLLIWGSSWDKGYFRKYTSVNQFEEIDGVEEMLEEKSFLGSKAMKLPEEIELFEFSESELTSLTTMSGISISVSCSEKLVRELMGTTSDKKAYSEFYNLYVEGILESEEIAQQRAEIYIRKNILPIYQISEITFYVLESGNPGSPVRELVEREDGYSLSEAELVKRKYVVRKDVNSSISALEILMNFTTDSRLYTSVSVGVTLRRI